MRESVIKAKSKDLAIQVIGLCDELNENRNRQPIANQLLRSCTSIGANLSEAHYASSNSDFIFKLQIALKECNETVYWLELLRDTQTISEYKANKLIEDCGTIIRMLVKSINTAKNNE